MTVAAVTAALNITYEGLLVTVLLIMMKRVPSSKEHTQFKTRVQKSYPIYDQNGQNRIIKPLQELRQSTLRFYEKSFHIVGAILCKL